MKLEEIWNQIKNDEIRVKEYDVTNRAIESIYNHYEHLGKSNYAFIKYTSHRRQISRPGAYLKSKGKKGIDIVGDILTSTKYIDNYIKSIANEDLNEDFIKEYQIVHHTIGNIIPIPEGANYGSPGGKNDNYFYKLTFIKKCFEMKERQSESIITPEEISKIEDRIINNRFLGPRNFPKGNKCVLRYWLYKQKYYKNWNDYVEKNFLQDFVDNVDMSYEIKDLNSCEEWLIDAILKRGYRIIENKVIENTQLEKLKEISKNNREIQNLE